MYHFMAYCYLVFMYRPKYKYDGMIYSGHYKHLPKVFLNYKAAKAFSKSYKYASYIQKVLIYE